mgnify:CR=1 FL=1
MTMNFDKLNSFLEHLEKDFGIPDYGCGVHVKGEEVFRAGTDRQGRDFFRFYSTTKPFTGFAAMQLIEQNRLGLYEPVSKYLPAFRELRCYQDGAVVPCKNELKIWHLLTMSGGFDYNDEFPEMHRLVDGRGLLPSEEVLSLLAARPLAFEPGTHYQYSLGLDILGSVIEKISGLRLDAYMEKYIFRPLGAGELTFWPDEEQKKRMCPQYSANDAVREDIPCNIYLHAGHFPSGGCGLCGTVDDYLLFLDMLANDGVAKSGERLLRSETMNLFRSRMLSAAGQAELNIKRAQPEEQALGIRIRPTAPLQGMYTGDGAAGAYCFADKEQGVSLFFAAHVVEFDSFYRDVHPRLFDLTCEALGLR